MIIGRTKKRTWKTPQECIREIGHFLVVLRFILLCILFSLYKTTKFINFLLSKFCLRCDSVEMQWKCLKTKIELGAPGNTLFKRNFKVETCPWGIFRQCSYHTILMHIFPNILFFDRCTNNFIPSIYSVACYERWCIFHFKSLVIFVKAKEKCRILDVNELHLSKLMA